MLFEEKVQNEEWKDFVELRRGEVGMGSDDLGNANTHLLSQVFMHVDVIAQEFIHRVIRQQIRNIETAWSRESKQQQQRKTE